MTPGAGGAGFDRFTSILRLATAEREAALLINAYGIWETVIQEEIGKKYTGAPLNDETCAVIEADTSQEFSRLLTFLVGKPSRTNIPKDIVEATCEVARRLLQKRVKCKAVISRSDTGEFLGMESVPVWPAGFTTPEAMQLLIDRDELPVVYAADLKAILLASGFVVRQVNDGNP